MWIYSKRMKLDGSFTSDGTLKAPVITTDVELKGIVRSDPSDNLENRIEFIKDAKVATVQFYQGRYKRRRQCVGISTR